MSPNRGRLVKLTGDGVLVNLPALDGRMGAGYQRSLHQLKSERPTVPSISMRIAVIWEIS